MHIIQSVKVEKGTVTELVKSENIQEHISPFHLFNTI